MLPDLPPNRHCESAPRCPRNTHPTHFQWTWLSEDEVDAVYSVVLLEMKRSVAVVPLFFFLWGLVSVGHHLVGTQLIFQFGYVGNAIQNGSICSMICYTSQFNHYIGLACCHLYIYFQDGLTIFYFLSPFFPSLLLCACCVCKCTAYYTPFLNCLYAASVHFITSVTQLHHSHTLLWSYWASPLPVPIVFSRTH